MQPLEPRRHAASLACFEIEAPAVAEEGETISVEIRAAEHLRTRAGLRFVDAAVEFSGAEFVGVSLSDDLPLFRSIEEAPGRVDLSAFALLSAGAGRAIGDGRAEAFATLEFRATDEAIDILVRGRGITVPSANLDIASAEATIEIIDLDSLDFSEFGRVNVALSPFSESALCP